MAVCAFAAGRLCDGVPVPADPLSLRLEAVTLASECYEAAIKALPADLTSVPDYFQAMKAKAILASACFQNGNIKRGVSQLGDFMTLSASNSFHIEESWPSNLNEIQKQERRRLVRCPHSPRTAQSLSTC
jgi:hypothetical protein